MQPCTAMLAGHRFDRVYECRPANVSPDQVDGPRSTDTPLATAAAMALCRAGVNLGSTSLRRSTGRPTKPSRDCSSTTVANSPSPKWRSQAKRRTWSSKAHTVSKPGCSSSSAPDQTTVRRVRHCCCSATMTARPGPRRNSTRRWAWPSPSIPCANAAARVAASAPSSRSACRPANATASPSTWQHCRVACICVCARRTVRRIP